MNCRILRIGLWLCALCVCCAACQKVELPPEENGEGGGGAGAAVGAGDALTVSEVLAVYQGLGEGDGYAENVAGYIVGYCKGSNINGAVFDAENAGSSNVLIADTPTETDADRCLPVELKSGTDVRAALNLADHPENLAQYVFLSGRVTKYFGVTGLKDVDVYRWMEPAEGPLPPDDDEEPDEPDDPDPGDGYGDVLTVSDVLSAYAGIKSGDSYMESVVGYIVGSCTGTSINDALFGADGARPSNMLIADTPTETDVNRCLPVELKNGTAERAALNLADHPENLGRKVYLLGLVMKYFGVTGLKNVDYYEWGSPETPPQDPDVPEEPDSPDTPDDGPDDPDEDIDPEQPDDPDPGTGDGQDDRDTIQVDGTPTVIPGGRSL